VAAGNGEGGHGGARRDRCGSGRILVGGEWLNPAAIPSFVAGDSGEQEIGVVRMRAIIGWLGLGLQTAGTRSWHGGLWWWWLVRGYIISAAAPGR
jgi:hypothetical protein